MAPTFLNITNRQSEIIIKKKNNINITNRQSEIIKKTRTILIQQIQLIINVINKFDWQ